MATTQRDASEKLQTAVGRGEAREVLMRVLSLFVALPGFLAFPALSANWDIVPRLSVEETYTDNLSLAPDALERSDWVTQVIPGIAVTATGTGLQFRANYDPELTYYARGQDSNKVYQRGNAVGRMELADKVLFLDAGASVDQYNISAQNALTTSNVNTTGNRATVGTFFVSPYVLYDFGSAARAEARYVYSLTNSNDPTDSQDSEANAINLRLASGPEYKVLSGDLAYAKATVDFENQPDFDSDIILANARRLITPTIALLAQGGYENYESGDQSVDGSRWGVGFDWTPSLRTRLAATAGRRFFGNAYYLDFRHRTRITTWSASYTQDISTSRTEFFAPATGSTSGFLDQLYSSRITDPAARQAAVDSVISERGLPARLNGPVNFFSGNPFLQKRWVISAAMQGVRNIVTANVFKDSRSLLPEFTRPGVGDFAVSSRIDQIGGGVLWNLRLTARDTWNLSADYTHEKFTDTGRVDDVIYLRMGFRRQFQPRFYGSLFYRRQQNDSSQTGSSYTENAVIGTLQMSF